MGGKIQDTDDRPVIRIALAGNPNSGKTTMFNKLTGSSQRVGNWPGVTVERKEGTLRDGGGAIIVDLPGIYSLSPYSPEEMVSRDFLLNEKPDAVINIVDASNLERNLFLTTQIVEVGIPVILALNMMDVVEKEGTTINISKLSKALGCAIVGTTALKGEGVEELSATALAAVGTKTVNALRYSKELESHISAVEGMVQGKVPEGTERWYALKLLERDEKAERGLPSDIMEKIGHEVSSMEEKLDNDADSIIAEERYSLIGKIVGSSVEKSTESKKGTLSDRIDRIATNRWLGIPLFVLIMFAIYYIAIEAIGGWGMRVVDEAIRFDLMPAVENWLTDAGVADWLVGLIVNGIIGGVGAVVAFLPLMIVLFLILVMLEECGYMSRVAVIMDHIFRRFGLSGKSFISLLIGMGCAVPGIMASRSIEGETERKITAMTVSFIPCSAKLPTVALIAGALFGQSAFVAVSVYVIGIVCVLMSGIIMKKWKSFASATSHFIMELPPYHMPHAPSVIKTTAERTWSFLKRAGTFVLLACVLVWFFSSFDWGLNATDTANSMLADIGGVLRWVFVPLGFGNDWEFTTAAITGLLMKENIVGTLGVLLSPGGGDLWEAVGSMLTPAGGYSFLLFNLICAPCVAAVGAMRSELGSWRATAKAVSYQCILAYAIALIFYQFATILTGNDPEWWAVAAVAAAVGLAYVLISKDPFRFFRREQHA